MENETPSRQYTALFKKSVNIKKRQKCSNICHLIIPILSVVAIGLVQIILNDFLPNTPSVPIQSQGSTSPLVLPPDREVWNWFYELYYVDTHPSVGSLHQYGNGSGFLGKVPQANFTFSNGTERRAPFFVNASSANQIDDILTAAQTELQKRSSDDRFQGELPSGAVIFNTYDPSPEGQDAYKLDYVFQFPNENQDGYSYLNQLPVPNGVFSDEKVALNLLHSAFLNVISEERYQLMAATIQEWTYTSIFDAAEANVAVVQIVSATLFPMALSLLLPNFVYGIVDEKQLKLRELMKMMGMSMFKYWVMIYLFDMLLFAILAIVFVGLGLCFPIKFMLDPSPLLVLLFIWGNCLIAMALFISAFLNRNRTITAIVLYLWVLISAQAGGTLSLIWTDPGEYPQALAAYPFFAFSRGLYLLSGGCGSTICHFNTLPREYIIVIGALIAQTFFFGMLGMYLDQVMPKEFGVRKPFLFPFHAIRDRRNRRKMRDGTYQVASTMAEDDAEEEDADVIEERIKIQSGNLNSSTPVIISGLSKKYAGAKKMSLNHVYLSIAEGEFFGLLGPNGAGKTTLISILTGLYASSSGTAKIDGHDIQEEMDQVHMSIGICPQFDIQWSNMTVEEHLLFYARLKGIPAKEEKFHALNLATKVGLEDSLNKLSSELSGGMQRRLSVAMALIGNPKIVFLDEPTSGLDPTSRRNLWEVLESHKAGRVMILTTHSMEEADTLSTRIGIIADGKLRCVGSPTHLKNKFGAGYTLQINARQEHGERVDAYVRSLTPEVELVNAVGNSRIYRLAKTSFKVSELLRRIEDEKMEHGIDDWGLSQTSLEEVFITICNQSEEDPLSHKK
eukprot:TRINITY_DN4697_c0_g1_i1.p1 TRINITY_DN4697_c0_g1~~TRINITY_DN4697_c0_g1_i1.p1  ORF type:complete len:870 (-),score=220.23 TRINITY_DN4697_c0_g1_i1:30-2567(-)